MGCSERLKGVVYDTSILMLLYDGVDVFEQVKELLAANPECIIPEPVLKELEYIASQGRRLKQRKAAALAVKTIRRKGCKIVRTKADSADEAILELILNDCGLIPATADRELRRRIRERGLPSIYYRRSRHSLMVEG